MLQNNKIRGIQKETNDIINAACRNSNQKKYKYILKIWEEICSKKGISKVQENTNDVLDFLRREYKTGLSYKTLQNIISTFSNRVPYSIRHHHTIKNL